MDFDLTPEFKDPAYAFFSGAPQSTESLPGNVGVVGSHWYVLDLDSERYRIASISALRPQADTSERPGEQSLSLEGLWRRTISTWNHGAGQEWYDRDQGDPRRFRSSRGVDPWTEWELSLLNETIEVTTDAGGWRNMVIGTFGASDRLVVTGFGGKCVTITSGGGVSNVTGLSGNVWAASTGSTVYVSDANGIHTLNATGDGIVAFNTNITGANRLFFAKSRLFAVKGEDIIEVIDATTPATPFYTNPWTGFTWTGMAGGGEFIYACGGDGTERGTVFAIGIKTDGTGLNPPIVALELPDGEVPYSIIGYVGFVVIGTNLGVRVATPEGTALTMGALVSEGKARALEAQDTFVWFGWDDTFADAAGLGRLDLSTFVETLAPAYATDLMGHQPGECSAVATFAGKRWFAVGDAVYREASECVPTGYVETGLITMSVADEKTAVFADIRHEGLRTGESIVVDARAASGDYAQIGNSGQAGTERPVSEFPMSHNRAISHELKLTLNSTGSTSPVLTGITLASQITPDRSLNVFLPVLIHEEVRVYDKTYGQDVAAEREYLMSLVFTQQLIRFTQGKFTSLVFVEDFEWIPHHATTTSDDMNGTMVLKLKSAEIAR